MDDEAEADTRDNKENYAVGTLVQKNPDNSQTQGFRKSKIRPLTLLVQTEEKIQEQAEINNEWETRTNLGTYKIKLKKNIGFCPLLNYPRSNCNHKKYQDGNCFETKTLGCRDGRIYLKLKKHTGNEKFSLFVSSYLSKAIDFINPRK